MKNIHPKKYFRIIREAIKNLFLYYLLPDSLYLKHRYKQVFGQKLNLDNPKKFSEKIQWLKIHDRNRLYHDLVDKYEVKRIIKDIIGEEYIIKTIGIWDKYEEIDFNSLPEKFILKCTHDSASVTICTDKSRFDPAQHSWKYSDIFLNRDYYHFENKQWAYKGIKPRIIAEEYLEDDKYDSLADYKFYCFNGKVKCVWVAINRFTNFRANIYDLNWNIMPLDHIHPSTNEIIERPKNLELMIALAEKIANYIDNPYVRVDFYDVKGKVYFGEITFYPEGGMGYFDPKEWDYTFGSWIDLSRGAV